MKWFGTSCLLLWTAITLLVSSPVRGAAEKPVTAEIVRDGANWTVEYQLNSREKIWAFPRSKPDNALGKSWRARSWIVATPSVRLSQIGGYDVLIAEGAYVPKKVKINFVPWSDDLRADYDPALQFSTGDIAIFDAHFTITPFDVDHGLADAKLPQVNHFVDKGRSLWIEGKPYSSATISGAPSYVLFGDLKPNETARLKTLIDPGMPDWLQTGLIEFIPQLVDDYARMFGTEGLNSKPSIWAVWGGSSMQGISTGGSVLPGFISMVLEGDGLKSESQSAKEHLYWFLAHEVAHFWLGQRANYAGDGHQWISEGGANAAAMLYLKSTLPGYRFAEELKRQESSCRQAAMRGAIRTGFERRDYDGYYSCGALFNLVADSHARQKGSDFFAFNGALIKQADASDRAISGDEWLKAFKAISSDRMVTDAIAHLLDGTSSDVDKEIDLLMAELGKPADRSITEAA